MTKFFKNESRCHIFFSNQSFISTISVISVGFCSLFKQFILKLSLNCYPLLPFAICPLNGLKKLDNLRKNTHICYVIIQLILLLFVGKKLNHWEKNAAKLLLTNQKLIVIRQHWDYTAFPNTPIMQFNLFHCIPN